MARNEAGIIRPIGKRLIQIGALWDYRVLASERPEAEMKIWTGVELLDTLIATEKPFHLGLEVAQHFTVGGSKFYFYVPRLSEAVYNLLSNMGVQPMLKV
jgi:hypothetical protein